MNTPTSKAKPQCILVIGGPCSGKGTYCKQLAEEYGLVHLSIGEILRAERLKNTDEGKFLNYHMVRFEETGKLMPSEIVAQYLYKAMQEKGWNKKIFLIDGFMKSRGGYFFWNEIFKKIVDTNFVLYLECSRTAMLNRMIDRSKTSGRLDDNEKLFNIRIDTFFKQTYPCIELLADTLPVKKVDTERNMVAVYSEVKACLFSYYPGLSFQKI